MSQKVGMLRLEGKLLQGGGYEALAHGSTESLQWQYSGQPALLNSTVPNTKIKKSAVGLHRRSFYENVGL